MAFKKRNGKINFKKINSINPNQGMCRGDVHKTCQDIISSGLSDDMQFYDVPESSFRKVASKMRKECARN